MLRTATTFYALFAAACFFSADPAIAEMPYRIAVIVPLSGQFAEWGERARQGAELAYGEFSAALKKKVTLIVEDDQFDPKQTLGCYQRLTSRGGIDAMIVVGSPSANALIPLTEPKKQVVIAVVGTDPNIVKGHRYAFSHGATPKILGERIADEIMHRGFRRAAFLAGESTGAIADNDAVMQVLKENDFAGQVVYNQSFAKDVFDFKQVISLLKAKQVDVVVLALFPGQLSSFAKQARQLALDAEITGMESFEDAAEVKASDGALVGAWYANAVDSSVDFAKAYLTKFHKPVPWIVPNAYDSVRLIGAAIEQGAKDSDGVVKFLTSLKDYHGAAGTYSASGDNRFTIPVVLKRVNKDGFVTIEKNAK